MTLNYAKIIDHFNVTVLLRPVCEFGVKGSTEKMSSSYIVLIDDTLDNNHMMQTLAHELLHIILGHFDEYSYMTEEEKEAEVAEMIEAFEINSPLKY